MISNSQVAKNYLVSAKKTLEGLLKREGVTAKLNQFKLDKEWIENVLVERNDAKDAYNDFIRMCKTKNTARDDFFSSQDDAFDKVDFIMGMLRAEVNDDSVFERLDLMKKEKFFYETGEGLRLAQEQIAFLMTNAVARAALKRDNIGEEKLEDVLGSVVKAEKSWLRYKSKSPEEAGAWIKVTDLCRKLAPSLRKIEKVADHVLKDGEEYEYTDEDGNEVKETKGEVMNALGLPFLDMMTANWYKPPKKKMVKDSSIT